MLVGVETDGFTTWATHATSATAEAWTTWGGHAATNAGVELVAMTAPEHADIIAPVRDALNACEFGGDAPGDDAWQLVEELVKRGYVIVKVNGPAVLTDISEA